ncbi:MAG: hypothetical protein K9H48_21710 [Melioribacteraceae bacterium]|nr:hypothetical protein [Candidatus Omnitrophota bacterium]MCF8357067.1 hypothetical protein [Melioribacteraceae bacterium]
MEKLNLFFQKIKELSFWQRIFSWAKIRILSYDAFKEFKDLEKSLSEQKITFDELNNNFTQIKVKNEGLIDKVHELEKQGVKKDSQIETLTTKINQLNQTISEVNGKLSKFEITQEDRARDYETKIAQLNQVKDSLEKERSKMNDERVKEKEDHFQNMKKQWAEHQASVEQKIKTICQNYLINYVDKVPFKGNPDNTIEICSEYIIFDAKSPANDDLSNFPKYIKLQTENVKKYAKQENVKKDIFLVIPFNTMNVISQLIYKMGDYNVYVITKDSLEPIILSLKRIEEYEFAEQLSPEDRDNICRIIGRFAHTTKRKIQIDQFFTNQFIELLVKCKNDLPEDLLKQVIEFEKSEKLNPPTEKRSKQILITELKEKNDSINSEAQIRKIPIPDKFEDIKGLE